jgi:cation diffusion facilitator family transporter
MGQTRTERGTSAAKESAAKVSILSIGLLIVMKVVASILTGSIAIRADAIHSAIDLLGAVIGFIGVRVSGRPADERHEFGHDKAENIAGVVIAGLIFFAAGTIVYEGVQRLIAGATMELVTVGICVTSVAIVINAVISWHALRVARSSDSVALEATARDMLADMFSSCAVLLGLILVGLTGLSMFDPIVGLVVAIVIARTAYLTMRKSFGGLMDTRLPEAEEEAIRSCITEYGGHAVGYHRLRTRKAGSQRHVDLHLVVPRIASVHDAHKICEQLEQDIQRRLQRVDLTIHVEPCTIECYDCSVFCILRKHDD